MKEHGFCCLYDALGGGSVTSALIDRLSVPGSRYFMYGVLVKEPISITNKMVLFSGVNITGFHLMTWWLGKATTEVKEKIRSEYSQNLIKELSSQTFKEIPLEQLEDGLEWSVKNATEGKILIKM